MSQKAEEALSEQLERRGVTLLQAAPASVGSGKTARAEFAPSRQCDRVCSEGGLSMATVATSVSDVECDLWDG